MARYSSHILGIVLNDLALNDDALDLARGDHGGWAGHLLDRVRQKEDLLASRLFDPVEDLRHPAGILLWLGRYVVTLAAFLNSVPP